jgi:hypothetical protein
MSEYVMRGIYGRWAKRTGSDERAIRTGIVVLGISLGAAVAMFWNFLDVTS